MKASRIGENVATSLRALDSSRDSVGIYIVGFPQVFVRVPTIRVDFASLYSDKVTVGRLEVLHTKRWFRSDAMDIANLTFYASDEPRHIEECRMLLSNLDARQANYTLPKSPEREIDMADLIGAMDWPTPWLYCERAGNGRLTPPHVVERKTNRYLVSFIEAFSAFVQDRLNHARPTDSP